MENNVRSDIAAFPELFGGMDQFSQELVAVIRRAGCRVALWAIPGAALLIFVLGKSSG